ncbi:isochorismate synthase [Cytobacillus sp. Sa5YUA1]|uniref:isochorismate synthase n=1 Tax=Cytobacillus stercorigallinarum TaxID=2762240 RepID=A0ABR8QQK8_9BACI|nr:isochorismate synthase [Cytobacillus stercorigallinarum]MBD7937826.1 isochorismate synthase [Cytobacillus stercorigallinarum]
MATLQEKSINEITDLYNEGDSFIGFPMQHILAKGKEVELHREEQEGKTFSERVDLLWQKCPRTYGHHDLMIGAFPLNQKDESTLFIPKEVMMEKPFTRTRYQAGSRLSLPNKVKFHPQPQEYMMMVEKAVARIKNAELKKVVLGRLMQIEFSKDVNIRYVLQNLLADNEDKFNFAVPLLDEKSTLIGSSPELLIKKVGGKVITNPLAGSRPRMANEEDDKKMAEELSCSEKDLYEHRLVVEAIERNLKPYCKTLTVPAQPSVISTKTMWHLSTRIEGELYDEGVSSVQLAESIHPTPAICGTPAVEAYQLLNELEPYNRHYFTGMVGYSTRNGDGEWAISIRCAELSQRQMKLFAGAGIVAQSVPQEECDETAAKLKTMLSALGIE